jgi:hypothetical protein
MNAKPRYEIRHFVPAYDDRDGICGWRSGHVAYAQTRAFAHLIVARHYSADGMDESHCEAIDLATGRTVYPGGLDNVRAGRSFYDARAPYVQLAFEDCPF